jgi:hypothetical protein
MKSLKTLSKLSRIDALIRDDSFTATQPAIGAELGCSDRMVRNYFDILTELEAPLINHGRMGWEIEQGWDFWAALKKYCTR